MGWNWILSDWGEVGVGEMARRGHRWIELAWRAAPQSAPGNPQLGAGDARALALELMAAAERIDPQPPPRPDRGPRRGPPGRGPGAPR